MNIPALLGRIHPARLLHLAFRLRPHSEFLIFQDQRLTRRQVWQQIQGLAAGLQKLGVQPGDRVATLLPACPPAVYTIFVPSLLGSVNVPLNPLLREPEIGHILADSQAKVVITAPRWQGQEYPAMLARLLPDLPALRHVVVCGAGPAELDAGARQSPLESVMAPPRSLRPAPFSVDDLSLLAYTSGTTGQAKGVAHTRRQTLGLLTRAIGPDLVRNPLRCLLLPFAPYHFAGLFGLVSTLLAGGKVLLMDRFDPRYMLAAIEAEGVTQIAASPTMYRLLLHTPGQEKHVLSSVRRISFSTEPCPPDLAEALHHRFGCSLHNIYGTTESMIISWTGLDDPWERAATTVGRPVPGARLRIVDETGRPLPAGQKGEIAVQTAQMMSGYYRDPVLTAQVLDEEGWFYTGDVGYVDADGYLCLVDRKKDLIIRGGQNVYPAEVEACLNQYPGVRRSGVIGLPAPVSGQSIHACIEPQPGAAPTAIGVLDFCRDRLAPFKIPEQVHFVERLPLTATGKVQKYKLREMVGQKG